MVHNGILMEIIGMSVMVSIGLLLLSVLADPQDFWNWIGSEKIVSLHPYIIYSYNYYDL